MNVNLKLIILHIELQTMSSGCLLDDENIISRTLNDPGDNLSLVLRSLLTEYLEIRPEWVKFNLVDVIQEEQELAIVYFCLIPSLLKNLKGQWIPIEKINDKQIKKLAYRASQHQGY